MDYLQPQHAYADRDPHSPLRVFPESYSDGDGEYYEEEEDARYDYRQQEAYYK